jgi:hypothetical protein
MPMKIYARYWSPEWEAGTPQKRLRVQELKARELIEGVIVCHQWEQAHPICIEWPRKPQFVSRG